MHDNYFPVVFRAVSWVISRVLHIPVIHQKYWRNFLFGQSGDFGSIFGKSGIELEIKVQFWWEWYFWKWHYPSLTQIVDFLLYHGFCSVNLRKHLLHKISSFRGKRTKMCWFLVNLKKIRTGSWNKVPISIGMVFLEMA